jgi:kumamolisin
MTTDPFTVLPGSEREPLPGATQTGPCDGNETMQVTVVLRHRPASGNASLADLVARGERLTPDEYAARYGADPEDVKQIEAFAQAHSLTVSAVNLGARTAILTGTVADFSRAFHVNLAYYQYAGGTYRGRTGPVYVPTSLKEIIQAVLGLDNRPQARAHFRLR